MHEGSPQHMPAASRLLSGHFPQLSASDLVQNIAEIDQRLLRKILLHAPLIIWAVDRNGIVTLSEGGGLKKLGYEPGVWVGRSIFQEFAADQELISLFKRTLNGEASHLERNFGSLVLDVEYTPLYNEQNEIDGFISVATDVTEKIVSQEELRLSEERFSKIFQVNPIAMCITEIDTGKFIEANESLLSALQCSREEIIGKNVFDIGFWPTKAERQAMVDKVKQEGTARDLFFDFVSPGGNRLCTVLSAVQIYFRGETFLLSCIKDVTREHDALEELETLNDHLETRVNSRTAELQNAHAILNEEYKKRNR
ncbi:PAS domain-containing protein, partial [uncultured Gimesia sp.]|uniref:PAS domain-containing protein n=1 Tax=uncultured Gimesia sp. TaxID=1678688 RepID=UPI00260628EB